MNTVTAILVLLVVGVLLAITGILFWHVFLPERFGWMSDDQLWSAGILYTMLIGGFGIWCFLRSTRKEMERRQ